MSPVLILDANQRSALAVTRSLGVKGVRVFVADTTAFTLAGASKYCCANFVLPDPATVPDKFVEALRQTLDDNNIRILFPMTDLATSVVLRNLDKFSDITIPTASLNTYDSVTNKCNLFKFAENCGIPIPKTLFVTSTTSLSEIKESILGFPIVMKPCYSKIHINEKWHSTSVKYAFSERDLESNIAKYPWFNGHTYLIQEYIEGHGQGVFALYNKGKPVTFFAHKRIREKPPSGGLSVLSESVALNQDMQKIAENLLTPIKWHGVAMIEFKVTPDGKPFLIEINGRFWGSLQLAIDAGVDFPYMLYKLSTNDNVDSQVAYKINIRSRWLLGDLDRLYIFLKDKAQRYTIKEKLVEILRFMKIYSHNTKYEINRLNDINPFLFELRKYIKEIFS